MHYRKHIFVCTHQKKKGKNCCGEKTGEELISAFKKALKKRKIKGKVRAQSAGCFDFCSKGPMVIVYPDGVYYGKVSKDDVDEIVDQHIVAEQPVERLIMS